MATKNFTGTVTIGVTVEAVTATLVKRGHLVTGTVVFNDDTDRILPIKFLIDDPGTSFTTPADLFFVDPNDDVVKLLPLQVADTTINAGFTQLDIVDAPCTINGGADTLDMDLDAVAVAAADDGLDGVDDEIAAGVRRNLTPLRINQVGNQLDHFGSMVSLKRLEEEGNIAYARRITEAAARHSNATYLGLNRGMVRELGLSITNALRIKVKAAPADSKKLIRFLLNEKECILYKEWVDILHQQAGVVPVIEQRTELKGMTVGKLADWINLSVNYEATVEWNGTADSRFLLITDSRLDVQETIPGQEIMFLTHGNLISGSVAFDPREELSIEIDPVAAPAVRGEYSVDHTLGKITAKTQPLDNVTFTYTTNQDDFFVEHSPTKITALTAEGAQDLYFNQVTREFFTDERTHFVNGLPTNEMYGIMRKVLTAGKFPQLWAE